MQRRREIITKNEDIDSEKYVTLSKYGDHANPKKRVPLLVEDYEDLNYSKYVEKDFDARKKAKSAIPSANHDSDTLCKSY